MSTVTPGSFWSHQREAAPSGHAPGPCLWVLALHGWQFPAFPAYWNYCLIYLGMKLSKPSVDLSSSCLNSFPHFPVLGSQIEEQTNKKQIEEKGTVFFPKAVQEASCPPGTPAWGGVCDMRRPKNPQINSLRFRDSPLFHASGKNPTGLLDGQLP